MSGWNESAWFSIFTGAAFKSTLVLGAAWLAAFLLRGRSAAARHVVWSAAAAAVLALPFLSVSLPVLRVPAGALLPVDPGIVFRAEISAGSEAPATPPASATVAGPPWRAAWRPDPRLWLMLIWSAGTLAALAQMLVAFTAMRRVRRAARPFPDRDLSRRLAQGLGIQRDVVVLETGSGGMPMTFGLLRPTIYMPTDAAEWSEERRSVVLLHELAHVRRDDTITHLVARLAFSLYWWNPLAWLAWREFLKERERATDDLVLNAGARASDYAGHLLEVARSLRPTPATAWAAVAMARRSQLEGRLLAILDGNVNRKAPGRARAVAAAVIAILVVAPFAAMRPLANAQEPVPSDVDATIRAANTQKDREMLERAASAFESRRLYDEAQKLREAALSLRGELSGKQSADYAAGLLALGDLARKRGKDPQAYYAQATELLGDRPETAQALIYLGIEALHAPGLLNHLLNPGRAVELFQRAMAIDPAGPGAAMTWMAVARQEQDGADEAASLFVQALASEDPRSPQAAQTMELYARLLREQGRQAEAEAIEADASAIRKTHVAELSPRRGETGEVTSVNRIGGDVAAPKLVSKVEPQYTPEARAAKVYGTAILSVVVDVDGKPYDMQLKKGVGFGLDESALEAISRWIFTPGTRDGAPVPVSATIEVNFRLM